VQRHQQVELVTGQTHAFKGRIVERSNGARGSRDMAKNAQPGIQCFNWTCRFPFFGMLYSSFTHLCFRDRRPDM
jgi:hypothetical protein